MTNYRILFEDLLDDDNEDDDRKAAIRSWACERPLESLTIGFNMPTNQPQDHELVWNHLGRFKKLPSLTSVPSSPPSKQDQSGLIQLFDYGVTGLLAGGQEGREMIDTLEEIDCLLSRWSVDDRKEMVFWFAEAFLKLRVLGLENHNVQGEKKK